MFKKLMKNIVFYCVFPTFLHFCQVNMHTFITILLYTYIQPGIQVGLSRSLCTSCSVLPVLIWPVGLSGTGGGGPQCRISIFGNVHHTFFCNCHVYSKIVQRHIINFKKVQCHIINFKKYPMSCCVFVLVALGSMSHANFNKWS